MEQAVKEFYRLQYRWKRLPQPDPRVQNDRQHPLHQIELELSHSMHLVDAVIEDVLAERTEASYTNALQALEHFTCIRFALELSEETPGTEKYKLFMNRTLELLRSGAAILQPPPSEP